MRRDRTLKIRLSRDEEADIKYRASRAGMNVSEFIREAVHNAVVVPPEFLRAVRREINRIGVNLNQIARALNRTVRTGSGVDCLQVYESLLAIQRDLGRLIEKVERKPEQFAGPVEQSSQSGASETEEVLEI